MRVLKEILVAHWIVTGSLFHVVLAILAYFFFQGWLAPERVQGALAVLQKEESAEEETIPDVEAWRNLETLEEQEAFLQKAFARSQDLRLAQEEKTKEAEEQLASRESNLNLLRRDVESRLEEIGTQETQFNEKKSTWENMTKEAEFAKQVSVFMEMKDEELAKVILARPGKDGDLYAVRVLRAITNNSAKKGAALFQAVLSSDRGGEGRADRILRFWQELKTE